MKPCHACIAASEWASGLFVAGCKGCDARQIARGPDFHRCRTAGRQDKAYRDLLTRAGVTHEEVIAAAANDKKASTS